MTEKTKLIRGILDAATADNLAEAERLIDEYTENVTVDFYASYGVGQNYERQIRADFKEYTKKEKQ
jgi:hypothetical protein